MIGGCSSINGNLFVRGDPQEYDNWRAQGCEGWGYNDMLPIFKRLEDFPEGDQSVRGAGGPIHCTPLTNFDPLSDAFLQACGEAGYKKPADYNDGNYEGAFYLQYSTRNGWRNSTPVGYLNPALKRSNLTVLPNAIVTRLMLEGDQQKRATGAEYRLAHRLLSVLGGAASATGGGDDLPAHHRLGSLSRGLAPREALIPARLRLPSGTRRRRTMTVV